MFSKSKTSYLENALAIVDHLKSEAGAVNSKLCCLKFNIDRKFIKNEARENRRQSIHKLELEKNLIFHPKKDRSKSIPTINMNLRLKALKHMKEDLLLRKSKIQDEIGKDDFEIDVRV